MHRSIIAMAIVGFTCGPEAIGRAAPERHQARPDALVGEYVRPSSASFAGLRAFGRAVAPSAPSFDDGGLLREVLADSGIASLDGVDFDQPVHVLVVDDGNHVGTVLLAHVRDAAKLRAGAGTVEIVSRNGWTLIGRKQPVQLVADYAFSTIAIESVPRLPTATVYLSRLVALHAADVEMLRQQALTTPMMAGSMGDLLTMYFDGLASLASDTDEVRVTLDASATQLELDFAFAPAAGSRFAAFTSAQRPSDFSLLGKLPGGAATMVMGGHITMGPYHDALVAAMAILVHASSVNLAKDMGAVIAAANGDVAMRGSIGGPGTMSVTEIAGLSDPAAAAAALGRIHHALLGGMAMQFGLITGTQKAVPEPFVHDGVRALLFDATYDASKMPLPSTGVARFPPKGTQHTGVAVFDGRLLMDIAPAPKTDLPVAIDAARGKGAHFESSPAIAPLLAIAKAHADSFIFLLDVHAMLSGAAGGAGRQAPFAMTFGASGGRMNLRVVVPVASINAMRP